ncbi:hypothetical protein [Sphingobium sp.]|uniref:hypothetical protein n=1 Tax=Sphingobium sp. TaxID=1912891 RepID=UPI0035C6CA87
MSISLNESDDRQPDYDMEVVYVGDGERLADKLLWRCVVILADGSECVDCEFNGCDIIRDDGSPMFASDGEGHRGDPAAMQACPPEIRKMLMMEVRSLGAITYLAGHPDYDPFLRRN